MSKLIPHKWQKEIKAWANGHRIEYCAPLDLDWCLTKNPCFDNDLLYRVYSPEREKIDSLIELHTGTVNELTLKAADVNNNLKKAKALLQECKIKLNKLNGSMMHKHKKYIVFDLGSSVVGGMEDIIFSFDTIEEFKRKKEETKMYLRCDIIVDRDTWEDVTSEWV